MMTRLQEERYSLYKKRKDATELGRLLCNFGEYNVAGCIPWFHFLVFWSWVLSFSFWIYHLMHIYFLFGINRHLSESSTFLSSHTHICLCYNLAFSQRSIWVFNKCCLFKIIIENILIPWQLLESLKELKITMVRRGADNIINSVLELVFP